MSGHAASAQLDDRYDEQAERVVARAQGAVDEFRNKFAREAARQLARMEAAHLKLASAGNTAVGDSSLFAYFHEIFEASHEIKAQAGTFGYDLLDHVCESLCCVVENRKRMRESVTAAIGHHILAVRAIVERDLKGFGGDFGKSLLQELGNIRTCIGLDPKQPS